MSKLKSEKPEKPSVMPSKYPEDRSHGHFDKQEPKNVFRKNRDQHVEHTRPRSTNSSRHR